ncbi:FAD-binding oxidoreductase [bacterium (Candidatus Blackallbacteria) CG17_big_fil_post_rev_8_21_14_2_50_48_46]|uniref:D-lactate dehydrogenase (cytochrome) n=1 Tax=bacterium (Candidatus Blackallbacteria) CG17_big_fil_post_rev_8_21_14_2_50_48_46 TaxID=2014261 RepID=A0A2M7FY14_9BACT|nr:MAG: FAD-binding oxidoreductase [bacterium (Candidatus Blackallbacteria) CG18_big_fil_WC_8_21_14_2_50_49_26]PIW14184.1 MAG: FAD-binding oxidoreductase [bacterium (Candidatus Blackallbacteria) CG17_big_fil_post_rev_8_21_14_2_50_48_46]PIW46725.1 MAG: FAD-binding oxidoreductase [bacterium (Candidatus Blackallbacteria) CG13_big_fil_rev_8_21_14_2_50_49_14]
MIPWEILRSQLGEERVITNPTLCRAMASDASFYHLIPQAVVYPRSESDIQALFQFSQTEQIPLTFRAAGTSLSGQAISEGILVGLARDWRSFEVLNAGEQVSFQPGVVAGHLNAALKPCGRKIGPDPASINACMMGGVLANNASGMCCGVAQNAYHTLASLRFILPSGHLLDTSDPDAEQLFEAELPELAKELRLMRQEIHEHPALLQLIRQKYRQKNTMGYSLNAFVDFETPLEILSHLLIGSEGTLAFISKAVLNTVADARLKMTGLLVFQDIQSACYAIPSLSTLGAQAIELMDRASLRAIELQTELEWIQALPEAAAALLVEFQAHEETSLHSLQAQLEDLLKSWPLLAATEFTRDQKKQAELWKIRKGLFPSVGAVRAQGTTVIIEDFAVSLEVLAEAVTELQELFQRYAYQEAIIFGHAKDGNLHFVITQSFNQPDQIQRYHDFMADLVAMIVSKFQGALKAEHGTGRNMAPFVETEWGPEAYALFKRLKKLIDPMGFLNPGVILNDDSQAHVQNLKTLPVIEAVVDQCIECGFCEKQCPSRNLSLTPRQRIVLRREMQRLKHDPAQAGLLKVLQEDYPYYALDTCATDGLCALACPVKIDTGLLVKQLRSESCSDFKQAMALRMAKQFPLLEKSLRLGLQWGKWGHHTLGTHRINQLKKLFLDALFDLPDWPPEWPEPKPWQPLAVSNLSADAVYFSSCITRNLGYEAENPLPEVLHRLCKKAGIKLADIPMGHCCGLPFGSKGLHEAGNYLRNQSIDMLWQHSDFGRLPVLVDNSPCTWQLLSQPEGLNPENQSRIQKLRIIDSIVFALEFLLPNLKLQPIHAKAWVHPVCSVQKMGIEDQLLSLVSACVTQAEIPQAAGCCGFAGDRGYWVPELTQSALKDEASALELQSSADFYCSSSRTCELGLERATQKAWHSYLYLLDRVSEA